MFIELVTQDGNVTQFSCVPRSVPYHPYNSQLTLSKNKTKFSTDILQKQTIIRLAFIE